MGWLYISSCNFLYCSVTVCVPKLVERKHTYCHNGVFLAQPVHFALFGHSVVLHDLWQVIQADF